MSKDNTRFNFELPVKQKQALESLSAATGWTAADLVRGGIDLLLEQKNRLQPRRAVAPARTEAA
jgi:predicted DNA-binding protein